MSEQVRVRLCPKDLLCVLVSHLGIELKKFGIGLLEALNRGLQGLHLPLELR